MSVDKKNFITHFPVLTSTKCRFALKRIIFQTVFVCLTFSAVVFAGISFNTAIAINTSLDTHSISPYIYGTNQKLSGSENFTAMRQGGNRLTGYNWENNASSAGIDWFNSSDNYIPSSLGVPNSQAMIPGIGITAFIDTCLKYSRFCLTTFQMAGYVSRDKKGIVATTEAAPSARWRNVFPGKPDSYSVLPDTTDSAVYMDEFMNYLKTKYSSHADGWLGGVCLDNEPGIWSSSHPLIHPDAVTYAELISKSINLASAIKNVDSRPLIFGPESGGFSEMYNLNNANDWLLTFSTYSWFVDYYLTKMRIASDSVNKRLLDVFDIHWMSEAQGNNECIVGAYYPANRANAEARIQAPRSLWDPNYKEYSWITIWYPSFLPLIPKVKSSIDKYYPGTKFSISEYNYGGESHISGGLAIADALGIFGKYNIFYAGYMQNDTTTNYSTAAFKLYRNYDGNSNAFGNISVSSVTSDSLRSSAYASIASAVNSELHIVLLNKNYDSAMNATVTIKSPTCYQSIRVWSFDSLSSDINERLPAPAIANNTFTYEIPRLTACHFKVSPVSAVINPVTAASHEGFNCKMVYPYLSISYSFPAREKGSIAIYSLTGKLLKRWNAVSDNTILLNLRAEGINAQAILVTGKSASKSLTKKVIIP